MHVLATTVLFASNGFCLCVSRPLAARPNCGDEMRKALIGIGALSVVLAIGVLVGNSRAQVSSAAPPPSTQPGRPSAGATATTDLIEILPFASTVYDACDATAYGFPQMFGCQIPNYEQSAAISLDPSDYPSSATFQLEAVIVVGGNADPPTHCVRLYDLTVAAPVTGSEVCVTNPNAPGGDTFGDAILSRQSSGTITLSTAAHDYTVQVLGGGAVTAKVLVSW